MVEPLTGLMGPNKSDSEQRHHLADAIGIGEMRVLEAKTAESATTGAEVVAWTRPPERPVVAIDHLRGDSWLAERDRREKLLAH